jgi:hypothetical protein
MGKLVDLIVDWEGYHSYFPLAPTGMEFLVKLCPVLFFGGDAENLLVLKVTDNGDFFITQINSAVNRPPVNSDVCMSKVIEWTCERELGTGTTHVFLVDRITSLPILDVTSKEVIDWDMFAVCPPKGVVSLMLLVSEEDGYSPKKLYANGGNSSVMFAHIETQGLIMPTNNSWCGDRTALEFLCEYWMLDPILPVNYLYGVRPEQTSDNLMNTQKAALIRFKNKVKRETQPSLAITITPPNPQEGTEKYLDDMYSLSYTGEKMIRLSWIRSHKTIPYTKESVYIDRDIPLPALQEENTSLMYVNTCRMFIHIYDFTRSSSMTIAEFLGVSFDKIGFIKSSKEKQ